MAILDRKCELRQCETIDSGRGAHVRKVCLVEHVLFLGRRCCSFYFGHVGQHVVRELKPHGTRKRALEAPVPNPPDDGASIPVSQDAAKLNVDLMPAKRSRTSLCRPKLEQCREAQAPPLPVIRRPMGNLEDPFKSPIQVATMLRVCASCKPSHQCDEQTDY